MFANRAANEPVFGQGRPLHDSEQVFGRVPRVVSLLNWKVQGGIYVERVQNCRFTCPGDGEPIHPEHHGWLHWFDKPIPHGGRPNLDVWPDVSAYDESELCAVPGLKMEGGRPAMLFSSRNKKTVQRCVPDLMIVEGRTTACILDSIMEGAYIESCTVQALSLDGRTRNRRCFPPTFRRAL